MKRFMMGLFGKKKDPKEQVRELQRKMRQEMRTLDRQVYSIQREEQKVKNEIKAAAKKGDKDVCVILAKSLLQSRKAVSKIHKSKAEINSVVMCMQEQLATMRMAGAMQKSTQVMKSMQNLVKVPEIMKTMREMSEEMMKLGIIEEMIEDTMDAMDEPDMEERAQEEVDRILWEVTAGELGKAPSAVKGGLEMEGTTADSEMERMRERLAELKD
ncbi:unnamed protein product, partial [Mesorhabditis belari]|uniref:Charged multivesicular body protein 3 n=2 Tax=Mesorhabditis belari TaxID=2138241 RepID=A0AAF3FJE6_9BILA